MKLLHSADLHYGDSALPNHRQRQEQMSAELLRIADRYEVGAAVLAGDCVESDAEHRDKDAFIDLVSGLAQRCVTVVMRGNHDVVDDQYSHLFGLARMEAVSRNLYVVDQKPRVVPLGQDCYLAALPAGNWTTDLISAAVRSMSDRLRGRRTVRRLYAAYHGMVRGTVNDDGIDVFSREAVELPNLDCVDGWLLGDAHRMQRVSAGIRAWYCGAPKQHHFGDHAGVRGVLIHDTDRPEREPEFVQLCGLERVVRIRPGEAVPKNAIVEITGSARDIAALPREVSGSVASVRLDADRANLDELTLAELQRIDSDDLNQDLGTLLAAEGLDEEDRRYALDILAAL